MFKRQKLYTAVLILLPLLILLTAELILRATGYGGDLNVVTTVTINGKKYYTMNQFVGRRYFDADRLYYRKGSHDFFEINKSPNTIRVFCFGESSTAGFPYEYNAIPTEFLRERLTAAFPGKNIEVINTAIAATNSFTVLDLEKELVKYSPDLFIFYMGQNEFYGVYGVGSTISIGKSRALIKAYLWLQQFKTFLLLKNIISSVSNIISPKKPEDDKILMEQMAKNNSIVYNGSDYKTAAETFKDNFADAIELAKENNIPVIISTLVTNEKDLKPFVSIYSKNISRADKNKCKDLYNLGLQSEKNNNYPEAVNYFQKSIAIDSTPADIHYELGKCYLQLKEFDEAEKQFTLAKDLDGLRFRAPSEFNSIIRNLSVKYNVQLADVSKLFREKSPDGIIGNELLIDHLHPNVRGYFLLAKSWFKSIEDNKMFGMDSSYAQDDSLLWHNAPVTYLDSAIGELKIMVMESRPPFQPYDSNMTIVPENYIEQQAYLYDVQHQDSWGMAHINVAKYFLKKNDYENAIREFKAVLITDENNPNLHTMIANAYFNLKNYPAAEESYFKASLFNSNRFIRYRLGVVENNLNKFQTAVMYLNSCFAPDTSSAHKLTPFEIEDARYNLAVAYFQMNDFDKAEFQLQTILNNNLMNLKAAAFLKKVKSLNKK